MKKSRNYLSIFFLLISCIAILGCKSVEIGDASPGKILIFEEDFGTPNLKSRWERGAGEGGTGKWKVEEGRLTISNAKNDPLWLKKPLPEKFQIEFDVKAHSTKGDIKFEILGDGKNHASGYILIFGGWNNSLDVIARLDEHGKDRKQKKSQKVKKDTNYHFLAKRTASELKWFVNGKLFMTFKDSNALRGKNHRFFAFSNWAAPVSFDNFKVYKLP